MLEAALCLTVLMSLLIGALDFGQLLFFHQALVERVRGAARWGSLNAYDGTGDQITNMVLYNRPDDPGAGTPAFLGLSRDNVDVEYAAGSVANPNDERITVTLRDYRYRFFSPWIATTFTDNTPITVSSPMLYKP
jgi:TadE-like protein